MSEITKRSQCQRFSLRKNALKHNIDLLLKTRAAAMITGSAKVMAGKQHTSCFHMRMFMGRNFQRR